MNQKRAVIILGLIVCATAVLDVSPTRAWTRIDPIDCDTVPESVCENLSTGAQHCVDSGICQDDVYATCDAYLQSIPTHALEEACCVLNEFETFSECHPNSFCDTVSNPFMRGYIHCQWDYSNESR